MADRIVAVDTDAQSIRILQVQRGRVEQWASAALVRGADTDRAVPSPADVGAEVRQLMRSSGIGGEVVASVSGLYSVCRVMTLPPMPAGQTARSLPALAEEAIPASGLSRRWQVMSTDEDGQEVLVLGLPASLKETQVAGLRASGVRPRAVELRGMALTRAVGREWAIIVNAEPANLDLVVVAKGIPYIMRTLTLPLGLGHDEWAERLSQALAQTVTFHNSHHPAAQLAPGTPLFLVGSLAKDQDIQQKVAGAVTWHLEPFVPNLEIPRHLPTNPYAVDIGLVLRQLPSRNPDQAGARPLNINLLPRTTSLFALTPQRLMGAGIIAGGLALANLFYAPVDAARQMTSLLQRELTRIEQQVTLRRVELNRQSEQQTSINEFKELTAPWGSVTDMVAQVQEQAAASPGVQLARVVIKPDLVTLTANAKTVSQAEDYVEVLRAAGWNIPYPRPSTQVIGTFKPPQPK